MCPSKNKKADVLFVINHIITDIRTKYMEWKEFKVLRHGAQMNSFNKTEAAVFSCRLCFLGAFLFISFDYVLCLILRWLGASFVQKELTKQECAQIPCFANQNVQSQLQIQRQDRYWHSRGSYTVLALVFFSTSNTYGQ